MHRRNLIQAALNAPLALGASKAAATRLSGDPLFSIAFVTDTHIQPELHAAETVRRCFKQIARGDYAFVIHGGDHVFDAMEVGRTRADMLMELYLRVEPDISHKVHHVLGNHDCFGIFPTSGVEPGAPGYGRRYFTDRFGPTYYSFDHRGVHFIVLDSIGLTPDRSYEGRIDATQLGWLKRDLAGLHPTTPIIVAMHIPLVTALSCYEPLDWTHAPHDWTNVVNGRDVLAALRGHKVLAVLQGHGHVNESVTLNGLPFITGGSVCGDDWRGPFLGTESGYLHVDVHADRVAARYINLRGGLEPKRA